MSHETSSSNNDEGWSLGKIAGEMILTNGPLKEPQKEMYEYRTLSALFSTGSATVSLALADGPGFILLQNFVFIYGSVRNFVVVKLRQRWKAIAHYDGGVMLATYFSSLDRHLKVWATTVLGFRLDHNVTSSKVF